MSKTVSSTTWSSPEATAGLGPTCGPIGVPARFLAGGIEMTTLAQTLGGMMRQTVVDRTGLTGRFDLELRASLEGFVPSGPPGAPAAGPSVERPPIIFTAVQEQLGLKLEPARGPIESFVIESASLPTPD